jgi:uncharacterized protein YbjT (DUF2867 family)
MAATILVAGATGNTGRGTVATLSKLLNASNTALPGLRILALTRSPQSAAAQQLASLPGVQVLEKNWVEITADWLREHYVVRAFIASHNLPTQFADESAFHLALLEAGVQYVVRISTAAATVRPDCPAYYPRAHWAIEALLGSPEFAALQWTSLQPNIFAAPYLATAAEFVKQTRRAGGKQPGLLRLMAARDAPVGVIDPDDVGTVAAHLLSEPDPARHNRARYVLNGPEDVTGAQIVEMVEQHIGARVESVSFQDMSFLEDYFAQRGDPNGAVESFRRTSEASTWAGKCMASTTSKEVLELGPPTRTVEDVFKSLLDG